MSTPPDTFAARLKALRDAAGLSQSRLAARAAVPVRTLQDYEQGRHEPPLGVAARLAEALGASLDALAGRR